MVLAMLVILVLMVVLAQVFYASMVEVGHAVSFSEGRRFSFIAEASAAEAKAALVLDLERDEAAGDTGGAGGLFGDSGDGGEGGASDEELAADVTTNSDSELDEWANVETLVPSVGDGLTILVDVVDEDSKINLLGLWAEDEDERERQREIVEKLLVGAFDGTSYAISSSDATSILDRLDDWVEGSRTNTTDRTSIPKPKLKPTIAEDSASDSEDEETTLFDDEQHLFLTMAELQMIEGIAPAQLWGFIEEGQFYPGLIDYLTIWSHLELKPEDDEDDDPFSASPFENASQTGLGSADGGGEDEDDDDEDSLGGTPEESAAQPTNNGLVNLNTASYPVLRALAPDEIPNSYLERIVEFREMIFEYEEELYGDGGLFTQDDDLEDDDFGETDDGDDTDEDEDDDITRFVFTDVNSVWEKIDEEFGIEPDFDGFLQGEFTRNFTTRSQVFTIKILILEPLDDTGGDADEISYRRRSYRTVVWRMQQAEGTQAVDLVPLEPFWDPRRVEDFGVDMGGLGDIRGALPGFDASGFR